MEVLGHTGGVQAVGLASCCGSCTFKKAVDLRSGLEEGPESSVLFGVSSPSLQGPAI